MKKKISIIASIVLMIDLFSKYLIFNNMGENTEIIKNFFYIRKSQNFGAAFSLFTGNVYLIIIVNIIIFFFLIKYINRFKVNLRNTIAFGFVIGGLFGNLFDRVIYGYVRDFLDFYIFNYNYPVFNIADSCIVIGVILMIIAIMKGEDEVGKISSK